MCWLKALLERWVRRSSPERIAATPPPSLEEDEAPLDESRPVEASPGGEPEGEARPDDLDAPELQLARRLFGPAAGHRQPDAAERPEAGETAPARSMRRAAFPFHIQHNTTRAVVEVLLEELIAGRELSIGALMHRLGLSRSTAAGSIVPFCRQWGLLLPGSPLRLTDWGEQLGQAWRRRPELLGEIIHQRLYTLHWARPEVRFSWAYARVADALWGAGKVEVSRRVLDQLVTQVISDAEQELGVPAAEIAFSRDSVRGALNWLRELDPLVITEGTGRSRWFRQRLQCPPHSLVWALDALYRREGVRCGERFPLTPERSGQLARLCVLEPSSLEVELERTARVSEERWRGLLAVIRGSDGLGVRLARPCPLPLLAEEAIVRGQPGPST